MQDHYCNNTKFSIHFLTEKSSIAVPTGRWLGRDSRVRGGVKKTDMTVKRNIHILPLFQLNEATDIKHFYVSPANSYPASVPRHSDMKMQFYSNLIEYSFFIHIQQKCYLNFL